MAKTLTFKDGRQQTNPIAILRLRFWFAFLFVASSQSRAETKSCTMKYSDQRSYPSYEEFLRFKTIFYQDFILLVLLSLALSWFI